MTDEAELNTIIKNSLTWASKIPDPGNDFAKTSARAFDGFGVLNGKPIYWEAKYMNKLQSFDLQRIADHQIENLCAIKEQIPDALCLIILGVNTGRADKRIFVFDDPFEIKRRRTLRENYLKKDLETLPYVVVKKKLIDFSSFKSID